ncbi:MAG: hypothetical protein RL338_956 [Chloroflexota bacterium]|jgi:Ca2+-binding RTX toxin-like protein
MSRSFRRVMAAISSAALTVGLMTFTAPAAFAAAGCYESGGNLEIRAPASSTNVAFASASGGVFLVSGVTSGCDSDGYAFAGTGATATGHTDITTMTVVVDSGSNDEIVTFTDVKDSSFSDGTAIAVDLGGGIADRVVLEGTDSAGRPDDDFGVTFLGSVTNVEHFTLRGLGGDDTLTGSSTDDRLEGGTGDDLLYGLAGDDVFAEGPVANGGDELHGGDGADLADYSERTSGTRVRVALGVDATSGDATSGEFSPTSEADRVFGDVEEAAGGAGDDELTGNGLANLLLGNDGADAIDGGGGDDELQGGAGADAISGGTGHDLIVGGGGDDALAGGEGDDRFDEEATSNGSDDFDGGAGRDTLDYADRSAGVHVALDGIRNDGATAEADRDVTGGTGDPTIERVLGGSGADELTGGTGDEELVGGSGDDRLDGLGGDDLLAGDDGDDVILGGDDPDRMWGGTGDDELRGGSSGDWIHGQNGDDAIYGEDGSDWLHGGSGRDAIDGGAGYDWCSRGGGGGSVTGCETMRPKDGAGWSPTGGVAEHDGTAVPTRDPGLAVRGSEPVRVERAVPGRGRLPAQATGRHSMR